MSKEVSKPESGGRLRLLILSAMVDGTDVSEPYLAFKWVEALSRIHDVTLLTLQRSGPTPTAEQLPNVEVVSWPEPQFLGAMERVRAIAKPGWALLSYHADRWIRQQIRSGRLFDVAHQLYPAAMRHRSPLRRFDIPYVIGPLAGMLTTPPSFAPEVEAGGLIDLVRRLDAWRLRYDKGLRRSFEQASAIVGVAPYVRQVLGDLKLKRFVVELEAAGGEIKSRPKKEMAVGELKLLHVGRAIRTKALRDVIRALALLRDLPNITLTAAGDGDDLDACREEAKRLGVADRVQFLGQVSRSEVDQLYASHDLFVFPSFREPMGSVFFEAMSWGLPILAARRGGPEAIFENGGAELIVVDAPDQFAGDIAAAVRRFASQPGLLDEAAAASRRRYKELGGWDSKAARTTELYRQLIRHPVQGSAAK